MAVTFEGNGVTFTYSGLTLEPETITVPGWERADIERSTLSNSAVHTTLVAKLRKYGKLQITTQADFSQVESLPQTNQTLVIAVPTVGSITYYADLSVFNPTALENDAAPSFQLEFTITNLNGTTETAPAFTT